MDPEVRSFIASTFRSVWSLELLLHLRQAPDRAVSKGELVDLLRASDAVVSRSAEALLAAGLVLEEVGGAIRYAPVSADLEASVASAEQVYRTKPDAVRRLIVASAAGGLAAFADAFRLRGE